MNISLAVYKEEDKERGYPDFDTLSLDIPNSNVKSFMKEVNKKTHQKVSCLRKENRSYISKSQENSYIGYAWKTKRANMMVDNRAFVLSSQDWYEDITHKQKAEVYIKNLKQLVKKKFLKTHSEPAFDPDYDPEAVMKAVGEEIGHLVATGKVKLEDRNYEFEEIIDIINEYHDNK